MSHRGRILCSVAAFGLIAATAAPRGLRHPASPQVNGPSLGRPQAAVADPPGTLFLADRGSAAVLTVHPVTGERAILSDAMHGSGPPLPIETVDDAWLLAITLGPDGSPVVSSHRSLLRIDRATGDRTVLSAYGQKGNGPPFGRAGGIAFELAGTLVLVDSQTHTVMRVEPVTGDRTIVSGCQGFGCVPVGSGPPLSLPYALAVDPSGALFVANGLSLVRVDPSSGDRTLVSGSTRGSGPPLDPAKGLALEAFGPLVWAQEEGLLRIDLATGDREAVSDGVTGAGPAFRTVESVAWEPTGTLVVADSDLGAVVRVDPLTGERTILAGGPIGAGPLLGCTNAVAIEAPGTLVVSECMEGIVRIDPRTGDRTVLSNAATGSGPPFALVGDVAVEEAGSLLVADGPSVKRVDRVTGARTIVADRSTGGRFRQAAQIEIEAAGTALVFDDGREVEIPIFRFGLTVWVLSGVVRVDPKTGRGQPISGGGLLSRGRGSGPGFLTVFQTPLAIEASGSAATTGDGATFLRVDLTSGDRTVVSSPKKGSGPEFTSASDIAISASGHWLVLDYLLGNLIRLDPATGNRSLMSGGGVGSGPQLDRPAALALEPDGSVIVINQSTNYSVRLGAFPFVVRVDPATGDRTVISRF